MSHLIASTVKTFINNTICDNLRYNKYCGKYNNEYYFFVDNNILKFNIETNTLENVADILYTEDYQREAIMIDNKIYVISTESGNRYMFYYNIETDSLSNKIFINDEINFNLAYYVDDIYIYGIGVENRTDSEGDYYFMSKTRINTVNNTLEFHSQSVQRTEPFLRPTNRPSLLKGDYVYSFPYKIDSDFDSYDFTLLETVGDYLTLGYGLIDKGEEIYIVNASITSQSPGNISYFNIRDNSYLYNLNTLPNRIVYGDVNIFENNDKYYFITKNGTMGDNLIFEITMSPQSHDVIDVSLYKNTSEENRVDKTSYLTSIGTIRGVLREESSFINPVINIEYDKFPDFNYVYIPSWHRYYFVSDVSAVRNKIFEVQLSVDTLMSYKTGIKGLSAFVDRSESNYNPYIIDDKVVLRTGFVIDSYTVKNDLFDDFHLPGSITTTDYLFAVSGIGFRLAGGTNSQEENRDTKNTKISLSSGQWLAPQQSLFKQRNIGATNQLVFMNKINIQYLGEKILSPDFTGTLFGTPDKWITSIQMFPFNLKTEGATYRKLYLEKFIGDDYDTGAMCYGIEDFSDSYFWIGEILVQTEHGNFLDYSPYTQVQIWLPFYGFLNLKTEEVIGKYLQVRLKIDYYTGEGMYYIGVTNTQLGKPTTSPLVPASWDTSVRIISTASLQLGSPIPVGSLHASEQIQNLVLSGVKTAGSIAIGAAGVLSGSNKSTSTSTEIKTKRNEKTGRQRTESTKTTQRETELSSAGSFSRLADSFNSTINTLQYMSCDKHIDSTANSMVFNNATNSLYVLVYRPNVVSSPDDIKSLYGSPLGAVVPLNILSGYTEVGKCHIEGENFDTATLTEKRNIEELLSNGVIL